MQTLSRFSVFASCLCRAYTVLPWVTLTVLYLASCWGTMILGHWPVYMMDDPGFLLRDRLGHFLYSVLWYRTSQGQFTGFGLVPFTLLSLPLIPVFLWACWTRFPQRQRVGLITSYASGMALLFLDPGGRLDWFFD